MFKHINLPAVLLLILIGCAAPAPASPASSVVRAGYCPTMREEVTRLSADFPALRPVRYPNAASAIQALHSGQVDIIIIGRKVHDHESPQDLATIQLQPGYTLITQTQRAVSMAVLAGMTVHTALPAPLARSLLPDGTSMVFHTKPAEALQAGLASAVLLEWELVEGWHALLIPLGEQGEKIRAFRTPFLVYPRALSGDLAALLAALQP
jgi:hypothetical protein